MYFSTDLKLPFYLIIFVSFVVDCTKYRPFCNLNEIKMIFQFYTSFSILSTLIESIFFFAETVRYVSFSLGLVAYEKIRPRKACLIQRGVVRRADSVMRISLTYCNSVFFKVMAGGRDQRLLTQILTVQWANINYNRYISFMTWVLG